MLASRRLMTVAEVDHIFDAREPTPVVVLKHSLACPLSAMVWSAYEAFLATRNPGEDVRYTVVEIQNAPEVSAEIARRSGIKHESPQVLLLVRGKVVWSANHWSISEESLAAAVAEAGG
jgi:bacillithiol system protein YtxJ